MAKVSLTKLGLKVNQEIKTITFNEQTIEVKQYLPVNDKLELIGNVINSAHDDNNFSNPVKVSIFTALEILYAYTNINFTEKQKEDVCKLYDLMVSSGFVEEVMKYIPEAEFEELRANAFAIAREIYNYKNSAAGIIETIAADYHGLTYDSQEIRDNIQNPENLALVKDILTRLG